MLDIWVAEVVKANCGSAYLLHDPLEAIIDCPIGKKAACGVREYQVAFRPAFPSLYPHSVLLQPLELKQTEPEQLPGFYCSWVGRSSIDRPFSVPAEAVALLEASHAQSPNSPRSAPKFHLLATP